MKKGLLSILAVALTVVGCQNYDDQFDELSDQITALSQTVQGLSTVADQITALQNTVNGLELTLGGDVADIKAAVDALETALADVATAADLGIISSTLSQVQADVKELLAANAVINQNITINNVATLEYVESLISTDADDPNVIVNGSITVKVATADFDDEHLARIDAVTNKFATSLKTVTIENSYSSGTATPVLSFANLAFVDKSLSVTGSTNLANGDASDDVLRTVTGDLLIAGVDGDLDLSLLTAADKIRVPNGITALKMGSVTANALSTGSEANGHLSLPTATTVDGGTSKVVTLTAAKATDIDVAAAATLTIDAAKALTIDIVGTSMTGDLDITAGASTVIKAVAMKSVNGTITTSGDVDQLHLTALTSVNTMVSDAKIMDLSALATQGASTTIELTKIKHFNAPKLDISGVVSIVAATEISVKDVSPNSTIYALAATKMTVTDLAAKTNKIEFEKDATTFPALKTLVVDGVVATTTPYISEQTNSVSITSGVLESVTVGGTLDNVYINSAAKLATFATSGYIRNVELNGAAIITSVDLSHEHIEGSDAASLAVRSAVKLTSLKTEKLDETGHITLIDLPKMTSLDFSSMVTLPQLGEYTITISETGLAGSYLVASELTTTTTVKEDRIFSDDLLTLKPYMTAAASTTLVTYTFAGDVLSSVTTRTWDFSDPDNPVVGAAGTTTNVLQGKAAGILDTLGGFAKAESSISTPVSEEDFAYVYATQ